MCCFVNVVRCPFVLWGLLCTLWTFCWVQSWSTLFGVCGLGFSCSKVAFPPAEPGTPCSACGLIRCLMLKGLNPVRGTWNIVFGIWSKSVPYAQRTQSHPRNLGHMRAMLETIFCSACVDSNPVAQIVFVQAAMCWIFRKSDLGRVIPVVAIVHPSNRSIPRGSILSILHVLGIMSYFINYCRPVFITAILINHVHSRVLNIQIIYSTHLNYATQSCSSWRYSPLRGMFALSMVWPITC